MQSELSCWLNKKIKVADTKQNAQFGGADIEIRHLESPQRIRRQKDFRRKQQICHQQPYRNQRLQVSRNAQSSKQESHAETISYVIYIKSVARTLAISIARQRPVKTVAEP